MTSALNLILCAIFGVIVGMASGFLGIGGGVLTSPFLRIIIGTSGLTATGTALMAIIPTAISGTVGHIKTKTICIKMGLILGLAGCLSSPLGSYVADLAGDFIVLMGVAAVSVYTGISMLKKYLVLRKQHLDAMAGICEGEAPYQPKAIVYDRKNVLIMVLAGLITGFLSGFLGMGGGFVMIPITTAVFGISMKEASGTSLLAISILALPGAITQYLLGNVALALGLAVAFGSIPGAFIGGLLAPKVPERYLRLAFAIVFAIIAVSLLFNELALL